jgi:hypothetical protein
MKINYVLKIKVEGNFHTLEISLQAMLRFYDGILKFVILNTISLHISREYNFIIQNQSIACLVKYFVDTLRDIIPKFIPSW